MNDDATPVEEVMLAEARVEIGYADHKASMVLASLGVGFGAVIGGLLAGNWRPANQGNGEWAWWVGVLLAVASVALAAGAVWPRYRRRGSSGELYYWGDVASMKTYEELSRRLDEAPASAGDRTRRQLWVLSNIVATKYRLIRAAFVAAPLGAVAFAVSAALA